MSHSGESRVNVMIRDPFDPGKSDLPTLKFRTMLPEAHLFPPLIICFWEFDVFMLNRICLYPTTLNN